MSCLTASSRAARRPRPAATSAPSRVVPTSSASRSWTCDTASRCTPVVAMPSRIVRRYGRSSCIDAVSAGTGRPSVTRAPPISGRIAGSGMRIIVRRPAVVPTIASSLEKTAASPACRVISRPRWVQTQLPLSTITRARSSEWNRQRQFIFAVCVATTPRPGSVLQRRLGFERLVGSRVHLELRDGPAIGLAPRGSALVRREPVGREAHHRRAVADARPAKFPSTSSRRSSACVAHRKSAAPQPPLRKHDTCARRAGERAMVSSVWTTVSSVSCAVSRVSPQPSVTLPVRFRPYRLRSAPSSPNHGSMWH